MPVGYTSQRSVQVSGFGDCGHLTPLRRLISASCSSGQHFASGFLQIRSRPRHPCLRLTLPLAGCVEDFHLRVARFATTVNPTAPVTALRAMPGAPQKSPSQGALVRVLNLVSAKYSSCLAEEFLRMLAVGFGFSFCHISLPGSSFINELETFRGCGTVSTDIIDRSDFLYTINH